MKTISTIVKRPFWYKSLVCSVLFSLMSLTGCSSNSTPLRYYVLHDVAASKGLSSDSFNRTLLLDRISIPHYLKQSGLVYQTSASEIHVASTHLWSEPVDASIFSVIKDGLATKQINVLPAHAKTPQLSDAQRIAVHIDDFIVTWQSDVILRGHTALLGKDGTTQFVPFYYALPLEEDGFSASVLVMRRALQQLSRDIAPLVTNK